MSEVAVTSSLICLGLLSACMVGAWVWIDFNEFRKRRREDSERRERWKRMRILKP